MTQAEMGLRPSRLERASAGHGPESGSERLGGVALARIYLRTEMRREPTGRR